jgi:magnesium chelatase family protein
VVAARVATARQAAARRGVVCNAALTRDQLELAAPLGREAERILERRLASGSLSARGLDRVRRVALTIADLEGSPGPISARHLAEALELRAGRDALVGRRAA